MQPSIKILSTLTAMCIALSACQSTQTAPVLARADATFETTGTGKTKTIATEQALASAKKQCGIKSPIILEDNTKYNGVLGEQTERIINKGTSVLGAVIGSKIPSLTDDDAYEYNIRFRCQ